MCRSNVFPRAQLREKLHIADCEWPGAVQAQYADVPMAVRTANGMSAPLSAVGGLSAKKERNGRRPHACIAWH